MARAFRRPTAFEPLSRSEFLEKAHLRHVNVSAFSPYEELAQLPSQSNRVMETCYGMVRDEPLFESETLTTIQSSSLK